MVCLGEIPSLGEMPLIFRDHLEQRLRWMQGNSKVFASSKELPIWKTLNADNGSLSESLSWFAGAGISACLCHFPPNFDADRLHLDCSSSSGIHGLRISVRDHVAFPPTLADQRPLLSFLDGSP